MDRAFVHSSYISCNRAESKFRSAAHTMNNGNHQLSRGLIEPFAGFVAGIASVRCRHGIQMRLLMC